MVNLCVAFICGFGIATLYKMTHEGTGNGKGFFQSLILMTLITSLVIMIIGDSLARAFGLVGAMSIIRFRTAVKDTVDILFIFFALTAGLAAGAGAHRLAVLGTLSIGAVTYLLARYSTGGKGKREYVLQFRTSSSDADSAYRSLLNQYGKSHSIVDLKTLDSGGTAVTCTVRFANEDGIHSLIDALRAVKTIEQINFFHDDRQY